MQLVKPAADREPAREPGSPLPRLSVPLAVEEAHVTVLPFVMSLKMSLPDDTP